MQTHTDIEEANRWLNMRRFTYLPPPAEIILLSSLLAAQFVLHILVAIEKGEMQKSCTIASVHRSQSSVIVQVHENANEPNLLHIALYNLVLIEKPLRDYSHKTSILIDFLLCSAALSFAHNYQSCRCIWSEHSSAWLSYQYLTLLRYLFAVCYAVCNSLTLTERGNWNIY